MDNAQFGYLVQLVIAVVGGYTLVLGSIGGIVIAFVNRSNGRKAKGNPAPYNGEERREIQAAIDKHTLSCSNTARIETTMKEGFRDLGEKLETHRNQAH